MEDAAEPVPRRLLISIVALVGAVAGQTTGILVAVDLGSSSPCFIAGFGSALAMA